MKLVEMGSLAGLWLQIHLLHLVNLSWDHLEVNPTLKPLVVGQMNCSQVVAVENMAPELELVAWVQAYHHGPVARGPGPTFVGPVGPFVGVQGLLEHCTNNRFITFRSIHKLVSFTIYWNITDGMLFFFGCNCFFIAHQNGFSNHDNASSKGEQKFHLALFSPNIILENIWHSSSVTKPLVLAINYDVLVISNSSLTCW